MSIGFPTSNIETTALIKLASIAVHADELIGPNGALVDASVIRSLLTDPEVAEVLLALEMKALLPVKRGQA